MSGQVSGSGAGLERAAAQGYIPGAQRTNATALSTYLPDLACITAVTGTDLRKQSRDHESRAWQGYSGCAAGQLRGFATMPGHHQAAIPALSQLYAARSWLTAQAKRDDTIA